VKRFICFVLMICIAANAQASKITYIYTDLQGTPLSEADESGALIASFDYTPYGNQALGNSEAGPGYTGHVNDPDSELVYMQARYYDGIVARFLSVDPAGLTPGEVFGINRFSYGNGNPVANVDPDGRVVISANAANNAVLISYINSLAAGTFAFKDGMLVKVSEKGDGGGKSSYYAGKLEDAINSSQTLVLDISSSIDGQSVDADFGGGATGPNSFGSFTSTISGNGAFTFDQDGNLIYEQPGEVLAHEIVGHALPLLGQPDTGNAVDDENKVRSQNSLPLRQRDPSHTEVHKPKPKPHTAPSTADPSTPSCGILCQK
jgi:RHS repeat-associated protein